MKKFITIVLSIILLFSFVGCENYLNERQLSHRKFKGEYLAQRNYLKFSLDIDGYRQFRLYGVDKIENGKLWYYGVDIENECYVYKSEETTVMDQVLFDGITEIIDAVGRKVVYTKDGLILSSGEKIVFVEEMIFPSKNKYDLPTSEVVCTFRGEECQVKKGVAKYLDANEIASRGLRLEIKKNIINSKGEEILVELFLDFEKNEK